MIAVGCAMEVQGQIVATMQRFHCMMSKGALEETEIPEGGRNGGIPQEDERTGASWTRCTPWDKGIILTEHLHAHHEYKDMKLIPFVCFL